MRRKPKSRVEVPIPAVFIKFMRHVARLIAKGDDATTTLESDDLLQCECAYGGLFDVAAKRFGFRYFASDDVTWDVVLDASQIGDIAKGARSQFALWKCARKSCDCLYPIEDSYCPNCDPVPYDEFSERAQLRHLYPDEPAASIDSILNLRQIVEAILYYTVENEGRMPPPFTLNEHGQRLHSWRSLILPFLGLDELYAAIDFTQPWDAPANRSAGDAIPEVYRSPNTRSGNTRYFAPLGSKTLWPLTGRRTISEVKSGMSYTLVVIEAPDSEAMWMAPDDIDVETLVKECASSERSLLAAMADGNATAHRGLSAKRIRELAAI